ncbi:hypothetical protein ACP275_08G197200 [Erythranthe tilingii]
MHFLLPHLMPKLRLSFRPSNQLHPLFYFLFFEAARPRRVCFFIFPFLLFCSLQNDVVSTRSLTSFSVGGHRRFDRCWPPMVVGGFHIQQLLPCIVLSLGIIPEFKFPDNN